MKTIDIRTNYPNTISIQSNKLVEIYDGSLEIGNVYSEQTGEFLGKCNMDLVRETMRPGESKASKHYYIADFRKG